MKRILVLLLAFVTIFAVAQQPFEDDIKAFKHQDNLSFPPPKAILFIGSSSITMWKDLPQYFPDYTVINRGFGGSSLPHVIMYAGDIIIPYKPKQIVIYAGENDLAASDSVTADMVADRFVRLFKIIRKSLPKSSIAFISMKPSPSRQHLIPKIMEANAMIKDFIHNQKAASFINVYDEMVDAHGHPRKELFLEDMLHMNASGYAIWQRIIRPYLKK